MTLGQLSKIVRVATEVRLDKEEVAPGKGGSAEDPQGSEHLWVSRQQEDSCFRKSPAFKSDLKGFLLNIIAK